MRLPGAAAPGELQGDLYYPASRHYTLGSGIGNPVVYGYKFIIFFLLYTCGLPWNLPHLLEAVAHYVEGPVSKVKV